MSQRQNCGDADCYNGAMITRYEKALKWIVDQVDNEDADLDDIILVARKALELRDETQRMAADAVDLAGTDRSPDWALSR